MKEVKKILISRIDSIGDVIFTFPICGWLKNKFPESQIYFLGRTYTKDVIACCNDVDVFLNIDEIFQLNKKQQIQILKNYNFDEVINVFPNKEVSKLFCKSKIPIRIGTTNRIYHWRYCNKLIRLSRKNSNFHETQLNFFLLKYLGLKQIPTLEEILQLLNFKNKKQLEKKYLDLLDENKTKIILHPKSNNSSVEWSLENYSKLIELLPKKKFQIFISGTEKEKILLQPFLEKHKNQIVDLVGKINLSDFISFINLCDGLIACSTGPLHIASALGKFALGLFPSTRPIHSQRWKPIGTNAHYIESGTKNLDNIFPEKILEYFSLKH